MKRKIASILVIGAFLTPMLGYAGVDDKVGGDTDRAHPKAFVKDSVITTKIKSKLAKDHGGSLKHIKVDTDANGIVHLSGSVNTQAQMDRAIAIAKGTKGVVEVKTDLAIKPDK